MHVNQKIVPGDDIEADREDGDAITAHLVEHLVAALELARAKRDDIAAAGIRLVLTHLSAEN